MAAKIHKGLIALHMSSFNDIALLSLKQTPGVLKCAQQKCSKQFENCMQHGKCQVLYSCYKGCGKGSNPSCTGKCILSNWDAAVSSVYHCATNNCIPTTQRVAGQCIANNCHPQLLACAKDGQCGAFMGCAASCNNSVSCIYHCGTSHWDNVIDSLANCAVAQCATAPVTMVACVKQKCAHQVQGCLGSTKCIGALGCANSCSGPQKANCAYNCILSGWGPALSSVVHCASAQCAP